MSFENRRSVSKIAGALLLIVSGALVYGAWRWRARTTALIARLKASRLTPRESIYDETEIEGLPGPVARYFRAVLRHGQPLIVAAHLVQKGQFQISDTGDRWQPFVAAEAFGVRPPGFVWDARIRMALGLRVHVRDAYLAGAGSIRGEILGLVPVLDVQDVPQLAAGALQRYLAEAPWFPTALLPSQGVRWVGIDDSSARATLVDGTTSVSLDFRFNSGGEIVGAYTPSRYRLVRGEYETTPWACRYTEYGERDGMRIPLVGEVEWQMAGRRLPYWRGRVTEVIYSYTR